MSTKKAMRKVVKQYLVQDYPVVLQLDDDCVDIAFYGYNGKISFDFDTGYGTNIRYKEEHFKTIQKLVDSLKEMSNYMHEWNVRNGKEKK